MRRAILVGITLVAAAAGLAASWRRELDQFRCDCGSSQRVETWTLAGQVLRHDVQFHHPTPQEAKHPHAWRLASQHTEQGPAGVLGKRTQAFPQRNEAGAAGLAQH